MAFYVPLLPLILSRFNNIWYQSTVSFTTCRHFLLELFPECLSCCGSIVHPFWSRLDKVTTIVTFYLTTEDQHFLSVWVVFLCRTTLPCFQLHATNLLQLTTLDLEQPTRSHGRFTAGCSKRANFRFNPCSARLNPLHSFWQRFVHTPDKARSLCSIRVEALWLKSV